MFKTPKTSTRFSFSSCGCKGQNFPTQEQVNEIYNEKGYEVNVVNGIQEWIVPYSGIYTIEASGASGISNCSQYNGGKGAFVKSKFALNKGSILYILVGQQGEIPSNGFFGGSGGGASFIAKKDVTSDYYLNPYRVNVKPLLIAAGGGGSGDCEDTGGEKNGGDGQCQIKEEGKGIAYQEGASGGAGFKTDAEISKSFLNGGYGGNAIGDSGISYGGFGGGGPSLDAGGGGGGYKGGDTGISTTNDVGGTAGTGGFSFLSGISPSCKTGYNANNNGYVDIFIVSLASNSSKNFNFLLIMCSVYVSR